MASPIIKEFTSTRVEDRKEIDLKKIDLGLLVGRMVMIIYFRETDRTYDSVNFDDPISTASYFTNLCLCSKIGKEETIIQRRREVYNQSLQDMMKRNITTKDSSTQSAEVPMHHIMRSAAEKIHLILREFHRSQISILATELCERESLVTVAEALKGIRDVMNCCDGHSEGWEILSA